LFVEARDVKNAVIVNVIFQKRLSTSTAADRGTSQRCRTFEVSQRQAASLDEMGIFGGGVGGICDLRVNSQRK